MSRRILATLESIATAGCAGARLNVNHYGTIIPIFAPLESLDDIARFNSLRLNHIYYVDYIDRGMQPDRGYELSDITDTNFTIFGTYGGVIEYNKFIHNAENVLVVNTEDGPAYLRCGQKTAFDKFKARAIASKIKITSHPMQFVNFE